MRFPFYHVQVPQNCKYFSKKFYNDCQFWLNGGMTRNRSRQVNNYLSHLNDPSDQIGEIIIVIS